MESLSEGIKRILVKSIMAVIPKKQRGLMLINPPPTDGRCQGCGRHMSELQPYGRQGDPLVGDFDGELLVGVYRTLYPVDAEIENLWEEFFGNCQTEADEEEARKAFIQRYGEEKFQDVSLYREASSQIGKFWLCRGCVILGTEELWNIEKAVTTSGT